MTAAIDPISSPDFQIGKVDGGLRPRCELGVRTKQEARGLPPNQAPD